MGPNDSTTRNGNSAINRHKTDEANLVLTLQLAAMLDCHCLHISLPYALGEAQLATLQRRLPRWRLTLTELLLVAELPVTPHS